MVLKEFDSSSLVPSIIHFGNGDTIRVGEVAKKYLITEPENSIFSVKRLMAKSCNDVRNHASNAKDDISLRVLFGTANG